MFNIGLGEILFIAVLVLVFIGPERLPQLMRQLGEYTAQVRGVIRSFNQEFAEELKPLHEIRGLADELNPTKQLGNLMDPDIQRSAPQRPVVAQPTSNPMSQISQSISGDVSDQSAMTPVNVSGSEKTAPNPMAQISQAMIAPATDSDSGQATLPPPTAPAAKTPATSPMANISQAMAVQGTDAQPDDSPEEMTASDPTDKV